MNIQAILAALVRRLTTQHSWKYRNPYDRRCKCGRHEVRQRCGSARWWEVFDAGDPKRHRRIAAAALALILSGCVTAPGDPIVDTKGADPARYKVDVVECGVLADQAKDRHTVSNLMGVSASMRQVSLRMCLVQRGWRVVG